MTTAVEMASLVSYLLAIGDDNLVLAQRLAEWSSQAPDLEEDIALTNVGLDLLGRARALYTYAGQVEGEGRTEDDIAFLRTERQYTNLLLVEQPNGDFAATMARQLFFDVFQMAQWEALSASADSAVAGIAAKALKESRYHYEHSGAWVIRLGDGTDESHRRMQAGVDGVWRFVGEMFETVEDHAAVIDAGIGIDPTGLRAGWDRRVGAVLTQATLTVPDDPFSRTGGRRGLHTEHMGRLLSELQYMQRTYPGQSW